MTAIALTSFTIQLNNLVPDIPIGNEVETINLSQTVKNAVMSYSGLRPNEVTIDVTGNSGRYYPITVLAQWSDEFSTIIDIQYPAPDVSLDEQPVYLQRGEWDSEYFEGATQYLFLPNISPAATEEFRVLYTAPYQWTASGGVSTGNVNQVGHGFSVDDPVYLNSASVWVATESLNLLATHQVKTVTDVDNFAATSLTVDIPPSDFFAICAKAACLLCREIATRYSRTSDSTIGADSVAHDKKAKEFSTRADEYCQQFANMLGINVDEDGNVLPQATSEYFKWGEGFTANYPEGRKVLFH